MRKLLSFLALLAPFVLSAGTVDPTVTFTDFNLQPQAVRRVVQTPLQPFADYNGAILTPSPNTKITSGGGSVTFSNTVAGYAYRYQIDTPYGSTIRTCGYPSTVSGPVNARDYLGDIHAMAFYYLHPSSGTVTATNIFPLSLAASNAPANGLAYFATDNFNGYWGVISTNNGAVPTTNATEWITGNFKVRPTTSVPSDPFLDVHTGSVDFFNGAAYIDSAGIFHSGSSTIGSGGANLGGNFTVNDTGNAVGANFSGNIFSGSSLNIGAGQILLDSLGNGTFLGTIAAQSLAGNGFLIDSLRAGNIASGTLALARGGTATSLTDPNAHRLWGWDDTDNAINWFIFGPGLAYDHPTHTISVSTPGGTVTSVGIDAAGTGITVTNSPITTNGNIALRTADVILTNNHAAPVKFANQITAVGITNNGVGASGIVITDPNGKEIKAGVSGNIALIGTNIVVTSGGTANNAWAFGGNIGTSGSNIIGTLDAIPFLIYVASNKVADFGVNNSVAIGTNHLIVGTTPANSGIFGGSGSVIDSSQGSFIFGGGGNVISNNSSAAIVGGSGNQIRAQQGGFDGNYIGGGLQNLIGINSGTAAIVGGQQNTITSSGKQAFIGAGSLNLASGNNAAVIGGSLNYALGNFSFASGFRAKANHNSSFVWSDSQASDYASHAQDTFNVRAQGGAFFDGPLYAAGFTNITRTPNTLLLSDANKADLSLANGGASTVLHGTTPPAYGPITVAEVPTLTLSKISDAGTIAYSNANAYLLYPTNTGTDGQLASLTGNKTKWITPGGGGDVTQVGQNNFTGSNSFTGSTYFSGPIFAGSNSFAGGSFFTGPILTTNASDIFNITPFNSQFFIGSNYWGYTMTNGTTVAWTNGIFTQTGGTNVTAVSNLVVGGWTRLQGAETNSSFGVGLLTSDANGGRGYGPLVGDVTTSGGGLTTTIGAGTVTLAKQANAPNHTFVGRNAAGSGVLEYLTFDQGLDWINNTRGAILYRGALGWTAATPGPSGYVWTSAGAGADPSYQVSAGGGGINIDFNANQLTTNGNVLRIIQGSKQTNTFQYGLPVIDVAAPSTLVNWSSNAPFGQNVTTNASFNLDFANVPPLTNTCVFHSISNSSASPITVTFVNAATNNHIVQKGGKVASVTIAAGSMGCFSWSYTGTNYYALFWQKDPTVVTSVATGAGLSGGTITSTGTLLWAPDTFVNNITLWDSANATRTLTAGLSGATKPVITFGNNSMDVTTGVLKQGGSAVALGPTTMTINGTTFDITSSAGAQDLSANRTWMLSLDRTATLAGNPALPANGVAFATTGIIFEGATADANEGLLTTSDPTADRTWTLPDADTKIPIASQVITFSGPTAARTYTFPDAAATIARTDAAQTFSGAQNIATIEVGNTDTTITRSAAGIIAVEGVDVPTTTSTHTLQNKTVRSTAHGGNNTVKITRPMSLAMPPHAVGTSVTVVNTNDLTLDTFMVPTFSNSAAVANNYIEWLTTVPNDVDTSVDPKCTLAFKLLAADTGTHRYVVSMANPAASAAYSTAPGTSINLDFAGDASGANNDVEYIASTTLTGWGAAVTASRLLRVRLARSGDATQDASTVNSSPIELTILWPIIQ